MSLIRFCSAVAIGILLLTPIYAAAQGIADVQAKLDACKQKQSELREHRRQLAEAVAARPPAPQGAPENQSRAIEDLKIADAAILALQNVIDNPPRNASEVAAFNNRYDTVFHYGVLADRTVRSHLDDRSVGYSCHTGGACEQLMTSERILQAAPGLSNEPLSAVGGRAFGDRALVVVPARPIAGEQLRLQAEADLAKYKSLGGGVFLEGAADALRRFHQAAYDRELNAIILDAGAAIYFLKTPPAMTAALSQAIATDYDADTKQNPQRVGVSEGSTIIVFGNLPRPESVDMFLADSLLGDTVWGRNDLSHGWDYPDGFVPSRDPTLHDLLVTFRLYGYEFAILDGVVSLSRSGFSATIIPTREETAANGGALPNLAAIEQGKHFPAPEAAARFLETHVAWLKREPLLSRVFDEAETCAVLRGLLVANIDLGKLTRELVQ
jgi:hypothetical protein